MLHEEAVDVMPSYMYLCLQVLLEDFSNGSGYKLLYDYLLRLDRFATMQLEYNSLCIHVLCAYLCYTLYTFTTVLFMCVCTVLRYYLQFGDKITNQHRVLLPRRPISCTYMYCDCASGRDPIPDCICPLYVFVAPRTKSPIYKRDLHTAHCMSLCPQV